jgi:hypothetical protein
MSALPQSTDVVGVTRHVRKVPILLQKWNGVPAFCQISLFIEGLLPIFAMFFGGATALWATI